MSDIRKKIVAMIARWEGHPGVTVTVRMPNGEKIIACQGKANLEHDLPVTEKSLFNIASVSKHFTAFAIRLLVEEGKVDLDYSILKYLPEMAPQFEDICVHHLVHHTSGLRGIGDLLAAAGFQVDAISMREQMLPLITRQQECDTLPGEKFLYTNTNYVLMAEIVRRVCGKNLREFLTERVFAPLGMNSTVIHNDYTEIVPGLVQSYRKDDDGQYRNFVCHHAYEGSSNLLINAEDFGLWLDNLFEKRMGDGVWPLMDECRSMANGEPNNYAFGLEVYNRGGHPVWQHAGGRAGYRAHMIVLPEDGFGVAVMSNNASVNPPGIATEIMELLYPETTSTAGGQHAQSIVKGQSAETDALCGHYLVEGIGLSRVFFDEDQLYLHTPFYPESLKLMRLEDGSYLVDYLNVPITLEYNETGEVMAIRASTPDGEFISRKIELPVLDDSKKQEYVGRYFSEELLTVLELTICDGQLHLYTPHNPSIVLDVLQDDLFTSTMHGFNMVGFTRDKHGEVSGLRISGNRSENITFVRTAL